MRRVPALCLVLSLVWVVACQSGNGNEPMTTTTDSAGVTIVTNDGPQWGEGEGWRLGAEPTVDLGGWDAAPEYDFGYISDAIVLDDGTLVVADGGSNELRFYDAAGVHVRTVGGQGQGPGEFESLGFVERLGDSLIVADGRLRRLSVFDLKGTFGRTILLMPSDSVSFPRPAGLFADGRVLVRGSRRREGPPKAGLSQHVNPLYWYTPDGVFGGAVGDFSSGETFTQVMENGYRVGSPPFAESGWVKAAGETVYFGLGKTSELRQYAAAGQLQRIVRFEREPRPVTEAAHARAIEQQLAAISAQFRESVEGLYRDMPMLEVMPIWDGLNVDARGYMWLFGYVAPGDTGREFMVFDAEGVLLGSVAGPKKFTPVHIEEDFVLGRWTDEDDLVHLQMYELVK